MQYPLGLIPNSLGFLALILYILTLTPGIVRTIFPQYRANKIDIYLLRHRRNIGVLAFLVALTHGILIGYTRHLNFLDPAVIVKYVQGITAFTIFTILAITSNDFSVRKLKKNWHNLHKLTYVAAFILIWHVLDKMYGHWSPFTYFALLLLFSVVSLMLWRLFLKYSKPTLNKQP